MISVGKNTLTAKFAHLLMRDSFNGSASGGTDEGWSFNITMRRVNDAGAHETSLFFDVEFECGV